MVKVTDNQPQKVEWHMWHKFKQTLPFVISSEKIRKLGAKSYRLRYVSAARWPSKALLTSDFQAHIIVSRQFSLFHHDDAVGWLLLLKSWALLSQDHNKTQSSLSRHDSFGLVKIRKKKINPPEPAVPAW